LLNKLRGQKRAKRSGDSSITSPKALAAPPEDGAPKAHTLRPLLGVQIASSHLVQPGGKFEKSKSFDYQQISGDSLEYTRGVLAGAKSLGIEMTPRLQRDLGYRRGQIYIPGSFSDPACEPMNGSNDVAATCDTEGFVASQGYYVAVYDFAVEEDDWGSDYAGIGHQFANLSVAEDKLQLKH
jgi:hypothetical protein